MFSDFGCLVSQLLCGVSAFLVSQLVPAKKAKVSLWLGLQHGSTKGILFDGDTYTWTSNQDVSFTEWNAGEPNSFKDSVNSLTHSHCRGICYVGLYRKPCTKLSLLAHRELALGVYGTSFHC